MKNKAVQTRILVRGETLVKAGDRIQSVYLIQSGKIGAFYPKGTKMIDAGVFGPTEIIGEEAILATATWAYHAIALHDTSLVEIPVDIVKNQFSATAPALKLLLKSYIEKTKVTFNEIKTERVNREYSPCPGDLTAQVFGVIFHAARIKGETRGDSIHVKRDDFKKLSSEVFELDQNRMEEALYILSNLSYLKISKEFLVFENMKQIENFFDFYQNFFFKSGYQEYLRTNSKMTRLTEEFLKIASRAKMNRAGQVELPYTQTIDELKKVLGNSFESDQLFRLEQKGLYLKRTATSEGGFLTFHRPDWEQMLMNWKVLKEIENWNEKGFVETQSQVLDVQNLVNPEVERKRWEKALENWTPVAHVRGDAPEIRTETTPKAGEKWCEVCLSVVQKTDATCPVCGVEIAA